MIVLAIAIILQVSKNCEVHGLYNRCDLHWTPNTPRRPLCSNPLLDGQIIAFSPFSCKVTICINGIPSKAILIHCWPLISRWRRVSGCLSKERGCHMNGKKYYEMHVFNAAGIKHITPKRICFNGMTRSFRMLMAAKVGIESWLGSSIDL